MKIAFVCASHDEKIRNQNLKRSPIFSKGEYSDFLFFRSGYTNVSDAYNSIHRIHESEGGSNQLADYVCYVHHDVFLPETFERDLEISLAEMERIDPNWGVLGVAGVRLTFIPSNTVSGYPIKFSKVPVGNILDRGREWGARLETPAAVDTLDELLLITKGDFRFDEQFDLHFYGADICMQAKLQGRKCYAINAYCHHNSGLPLGFRSVSFRACEAKFRAKYIDHLPIATTCSILI